MKYIRGFLMAWGNFSAIPCPYRKWHEDARKAQLSMLPVVGMLLAVIINGLLRILDYTTTPAVLTGTLLTAVYFILTGFIHLDGFMDCSDAIMSRRQELAERQRILKDSTVGAFAVICVVLMFLVFTASMITLAEDFSVWKSFSLIGIMMVSRSFAADAIIRKPVMNISQYAALNEQKSNTSSDVIVLWSVTAIVLCLLFYRIAKIGLADSYENIENLYTYAGASVVTALTALITGYRDRKNLGGMNGDIAGHMITMSETVGIMAAAILSAW